MRNTFVEAVSGVPGIDGNDKPGRILQMLSA